MAFQTMAMNVSTNNDGNKFEKCVVKYKPLPAANSLDLEEDWISNLSHNVFSEWKTNMKRGTL